MSLGVLLLQPVFMVLPLLALATLAFGAGWTVIVVLLVSSGLWEGFIGVRARRRTLAESAEAPSDAGHDLGAVITRADGHAGLWSLVDDIAAEAGVTPPAQIVVTLATAAAVRPLPDEAVGGTVRDPDTHPYELVLSANVLALASVPELQAVLSHELGHIARSTSVETAGGRFATRWAGPFYEGLPVGFLKAGGWLHLTLWRAVDAWASRPGERLADDVSFRVAGPRTTAAALAHIDRITAAEVLVEELYVPLAIRARLRPSVLDGVRQVLASPHDQLDSVLRAARPRRLDWMLATHPTTTERIAAAHRAVASGRGAAADARAVAAERVHAADLLDGGLTWLVDHESDYFVDDDLLTNSPGSDWATAVDRGWRGLVADSATDLVDTATSPADAKGKRLPRGRGVAAPVDAEPDEVTASLMLTAAERLGIGPVVHDRGLDEPGRRFVLAIIAARALDRAGHLRMPLAWTGESIPEYLDGERWWAFRSASEIEDVAPAQTSPLDRMLREVAAGREPVAALIALLVAAGADLHASVALTAAERAQRPGLFLGAHSGVTVRRGDHELDGTWGVVFGTSGAWLVPEQAPEGWRMAAERDIAQKELIQHAAEAFTVVGGPQLPEFPDSLWLPEVELAEVHTRGTITVEADLLLRDGSLVSLRMPATAPTLGRVAIQALHQMVGNRLHVE